MKKSFIYLRKISVMVCVYEILSQRECWDTYELKEIVLFPEILLLGVNSIKYMYIKHPNEFFKKPTCHSMDYWRIRIIPFISWRNLLRSNSRPSKNAWIYQRRVKKKMNCLLVGPVQVLYVFVINRFKWEVINMKTPIEQSQAEFTKNALNKTGMW